MGKGRANTPDDDDEVSKGKHGIDLSHLDMKQRDPNNLNPHLKVFFEDIIGEPEGSHSVDCVWTNSYKCFWSGKDCCYTVLTYVCSIPLAFCWGCQFACITFSHIWTITPCLYLFNVNFSCLSRCYATLIHCLCDPVYEATSLMFTQIFFNHVTNAQSYKGKDVTKLNLMNRKGTPGSEKSRMYDGEANDPVEYDNVV